MRAWDLADGDEIHPGLTAVRLLGGGHRYEAYLAWHDRMRHLVVAKVLRPDHCGRRRSHDALTAEAELLGRLAHPLLVRSFGAAPDAERPHLLLEHLEGPRLSTLIRRYGVILEQVLPLGMNLSSALHYVHGEGVVHLDVKPRNIIMAGAPRLIDLSVARRLADVALVESPVGTDAYMAPEQCHPDLFASIGPKSDVWGLGATLHEALTGDLPFPRRDGDRYPQLSQSPQRPRGRLPGELVDLVMACLEPDPADRPSAAQVGDALEPLVEQLPAPRIGRFRPGARPLAERLDAS